MSDVTRRSHSCRISQDRSSYRALLVLGLCAAATCGCTAGPATQESPRTTATATSTDVPREPLNELNVQNCAAVFPVVDLPLGSRLGRGVDTIQLPGVTADVLALGRLGRQPAGQVAVTYPGTDRRDGPCALVQGTTYRIGGAVIRVSTVTPKVSDTNRFGAISTVEYWSADLGPSTSPMA